MTAVSFIVYGQAAPAGSKTPGVTKSGRRFVRDANPNAADWKRQVRQAAGEAMDGRNALLDGPLVLTAWFYQPRPRNHYGSGRNSHKVKASAPQFPITAPDTTKLVRAIEDAMQGIVYRNDAQIVRQSAGKHYGEPARVEIRVSAEAHWL